MNDPADGGVGRMACLWHCFFLVRAEPNGEDGGTDVVEGALRTKKAHWFEMGYSEDDK